MSLLTLRNSDRWTAAAAVYALVAAIALPLWIRETFAIVLVVPPAVVALLPAVVGHRARPRAATAGAAILAGWGVVGIALLGVYFLPAALLLAVAAMQASGQELRTELRTEPRT